MRKIICVENEEKDYEAFKNFLGWLNEYCNDLDVACMCCPFNRICYNKEKAEEKLDDLLDEMMKVGSWKDEED